VSRHKRTSGAAEELRKGLIFLIGIAAFYTLFWLLISSLNLAPLKSFVAVTSNGLLNIAGVPTQLVYCAEPTIIVDGINAQIGNLCAGDVEIALLLAIVLATWDRTWRQRFWGCVFGFLTIMVLNPLRIFAVLAVGFWTSWRWADFTHDVLFRLMLLAVIFGYYYIWYVKYDFFTNTFKSVYPKHKLRKRRQKR
jgi:exosortase/archaeosortase family protein